MSSPTYAATLQARKECIERRIEDVNRRLTASLATRGASSVERAKLMDERRQLRAELEALWRQATTPQSEMLQALATQRIARAVESCVMCLSVIGGVLLLEVASRVLAAIGVASTWIWAVWRLMP